jgi:hypothetical protein
MDEFETTTPVRPQVRQFVAMLVIAAATAQTLGLTLRTPTQLEANDISRWCTVWSLLERHTYAIDDCPWQSKTQDKVKKPDKLAAPAPGDSPLRKFEYRLAPASWKQGEPTEHFYSSKPPLLPTVIAGILYPFRAATGVPLDRSVPQARNPRNVQKPDPDAPGKIKFVLETPKDPVQWPAHVFYLKPVIILLNIVPTLAFLVLYARLLDRYAANDWAWFAALVAAAFGTYLTSFDQTLNNHTVAAYSAFFAIYLLVRIWDDEDARTWSAFAGAGFWGAFCACNELPAALFGVLLFLVLFVRSPRLTLFGFVPAAAVPCVAFLATQYLAFGQFKPVYEEFGTKSYNYEGSPWNTPLEMDWFNAHPEPKPMYLFHMVLGHHGVLSLSPIFLFSALGMLRLLGRRGGLGMSAWLTAILTAAMLAFYTWNPKARNYGGSTQGLRWLFWLIPFWLAVLPTGLEPGQDRRWFRWLVLLALFVSVLSAGYALRTPWSHPWVLDAMEHLGLYTLKR